jgi:hypothetical protein
VTTMSGSVNADHADHAEQVETAGDDEDQKKKPDQRKSFFLDHAAAVSFDSALVKKLGAIQSNTFSSLLPLENVQRYTHGRNLRHPAATNFYDGGMHTHSTAMTAKFQDLIEHNISVLDDALKTFERSSLEQMNAMFYGTLSASCEANGNIVDANAEGSFLAGLEAMLEKIEIGVDAQGNPQIPEIRMGSAAFAKMQIATASASPEDHARIEALRDRKIAEGRSREIARQAKFA